MNKYAMYLNSFPWPNGFCWKSPGFFRPLLRLMSSQRQLLAASVKSCTAAYSRLLGRFWNGPWCFWWKHWVERPKSSLGGRSAHWTHRIRARWSLVFKEFTRIYVFISSRLVYDFCIGVIKYLFFFSIYLTFNSQSHLVTESTPSLLKMIIRNIPEFNATFPQHQQLQPLKWPSSGISTCKTAGLH